MTRTQALALVRKHGVVLEAGRHEIEALAFPKWVPARVQREARRLIESQAVAALGQWLTAQVSAKA